MAKMAFKQLYSFKNRRLFILFFYIDCSKLS
uniref:Uncharacterized protein n=1 Tax=Anguilla anguilla TaxID=7936 RepID=A0A0E9VFC7_ANGAN